MRCLIPLMLAVCAAPAFAQQGAPLDKIYACTSITEATARLACFDAAVASLKQAEAAGGVAVVERSQIEKAEKEAFGLPTPTLSEIARSAAVASSAPVAAAGASPSAAPKPPAPAALDRITLTIKSAEKRPDGTYRFVMENGQIWLQTDTINMGRLSNGPWTAEIKKAALGSYMLKVGDRTAVRVKRLE